MGERECSVQRRHQKILEETPSPSISDSLREKLLSAAVQLGHHVRYGSAGTVEFVVDGEENFYFLEMNTRLQVEHTVTEEVTGIDIVEWMLRLASNEAFSLSQSDITFSGHSIEARLYAEDPTVGFLPSIGKLVHFEAEQKEGIRIESGVEGGSEVTLFYDPMIAKVISYGASRKQALEYLDRCLERLIVRGVHTNRLFLREILNHTDFQKGHVSTHFIADYFGDAFKPIPTSNQRETFLAIALCLQSKQTGQTSFVLQIQGEEERVKASIQGSTLIIGESEKAHSVSLDWIPGRPLGTLILDEVEHVFQAFPLDNHLGWKVSQGVFEVNIRLWPGHMEKFMSRIPLERVASQKTVVSSPMPGRVLDVFVQPGDSCKVGQRLAIVEAMKMENIIRAPTDLAIQDVLVQPGDSVTSGQALLKVA